MSNLSTRPARIAKNINSLNELIEEFSEQALVKFHSALALFEFDLKSLVEDTRNFALDGSNNATERKSEAGNVGFDRYFLFKIILISMFLGVSLEKTCDLMMFDTRVRLILGIKDGDRIPSSSTLYLAELRFNANQILQKAFFIITNKIVTSKEYLPFSAEDIAIDSTYMESPIAQLTSSEKEAIKSGTIDTIWQSNPNRGRQIDKDAWYSIKQNDLHYGYKLHCKVGVLSKFVLNNFTTPGNYSDFNCMEDLLEDTDTNRSAYLDSGYKSKKNEDILLSRGIEPMIVRRKAKGKELSSEDQEYNLNVSHYRSAVEHVFGSMEMMFGIKTRRHGEFNATETGFGYCFLYNIISFYRLVENHEEQYKAILDSLKDITATRETQLANWEMQNQLALEEYIANEKEREKLLDNLEDWSLYVEADTYPITDLSPVFILSDMRTMLDDMFNNMDDLAYESAFQEVLDLIKPGQ